MAKVFREATDYKGEPYPVHAPATLEEVTAAQDALGCRFPDSYVWFQLEFGNARNGPLEVYTVRPAEEYVVNIVDVNLEERRDGQPALPAHLIAFSDSGGGDLNCFDTSALENGECPVVWWDHEQDDDQTPEVAGATFLDWIEAELRERAEEGEGSLLDGLRDVHLGWMREWLKKK